MSLRFQDFIFMNESTGSTRSFHLDLAAPHVATMTYNQATLSTIYLPLAVQYFDIVRTHCLLYHIYIYIYIYIYTHIAEMGQEMDLKKMKGTEYSLQSAHFRTSTINGRI